MCDQGTEEMGWGADKAGRQALSGWAADKRSLGLLLALLAPHPSCSPSCSTVAGLKCGVSDLSSGSGREDPQEVPRAQPGRRLRSP